VTKQFIEEPPHGENHGSKASTEPDKGGRQIPLDVETMLSADLMRSEGFGVVETSRGSGATGSTYGAKDAGMTAHRGILHPDEYVDPDVLTDAVEAALGYSYEDVSSAYKNGRPTAEQRQLRDRIDSRVLALSRSGGNMALLARTLEVSEKTIDRALVRARENEVTPIVTAPAVTTRCVSFMTGEPGAKPRRRAHAGCPSHMLPDEAYRYSTINLSDEEYERGLRGRPGNPAYWEFRLGTSPLRGSYVAPRKTAQKFPAEYPSDESYRQFVGA
jgi:hypothetical protein